LQVYLHYLYEKATSDFGVGQSDVGGTLPKSHIRNPIFTEGVVKAVGQLGNVLKRFIESQLEAAQTFFATLGLPNDFAARMLDEFATDEGTKQSRKATELSKALNTEGSKVKAALHYFSEGKLLRADEDDVERYEPVHDVVAKQIHELRSAEDKEYKAFARQLQLAHEAWLRDGKPTQRLLNELDLSKVAIYEDRLKRLPNADILTELIDKSRQQVADLQKRERQRRNILLGITIAALLGLGIAVFQYFVAVESKKEALANLKKAEDREDARLKAEAKTELTQFNQLMENIENNILPAAGACPDAAMYKRIEAMKTHYLNDKALQDRIQELNQKLKLKNCIH
jgi:hypothetical protein